MREEFVHVIFSYGYYMANFILQDLKLYTEDCTVNHF